MPHSLMLVGATLHRCRFFNTSVDFQATDLVAAPSTSWWQDLDKGVSLGGVRFLAGITRARRNRL